jgi:hypothetical protein
MVPLVTARAGQTWLPLMTAGRMAESTYSARPEGEYDGHSQVLTASIVGHCREGAAEGREVNSSPVQPTYDVMEPTTGLEGAGNTRRGRWGWGTSTPTTSLSSSSLHTARPSPCTHHLSNHLS